ncbi:hypothetical protein COLO4_33010 [Corchorus olitorius]|uniref:Uncharacterized protein n=1 Tax=Corchorus olitorius TaxID=93759 RepID=A0A1R3GWU7_9ROSI|nr:hypothetical protein COLO4_33010 [Corchorus olitorius]
MVLSTTDPAPEQQIQSSTFASRYVRDPLPSRAVRRAIFGREQNGEVSSRGPREEGSLPIQNPGGGVFSIGHNQRGGSRRLRSFPARSGDLRYNFPGRNPQKGKAVMGAVGRRGVREGGEKEDVGDLDQNRAEVGDGISMGSSAHIIPGVGLAKKGPNGSNSKEARNVNQLMEGSGCQGVKEVGHINGPVIIREGMENNKAQEQRKEAVSGAAEAFVFGAKSATSCRRQSRKWKTAARVADKYTLEALLQQQIEVGKKRRDCSRNTRCCNYWR